MSFAATALRMSSGVIVWAAHFAAIYGYTGLACARDLAHTVPAVVALATVLAVLSTLAIIGVGWRRRQLFEFWMTAALGVSALVAIVWEAVPVLIVPTCG